MKVFDSDYFNVRREPADTLGDVWNAVGAIGAAGVQVGLPLLLQGASGGSTGGVARGLAAINAFGRQAIDTLNQILTGLRGRQLSPADAISNAQRIAAALSDPAVVYQAQRGDDAAALQGFKAEAAQIVQQIQTIAAGGASSSGAVASPNGSTAAGSQSAAGGAAGSVFGMSSTTLLLFGALAVGGILLLKK